MMAIAAVISIAVNATREEPDSVAEITTVQTSGDVMNAEPDRRIPQSTPVDIDDNKPRVVMHYYDKHGDLLDEPVMFLATLDTVTKPKSKPIYPTYNGIDVGINFGEAILLAFGQKHAGFDANVAVSLWNWLFPVVECGVGYALDTPKNQNYSYRTSPAVYTKLGFNYNFLYKSSPDYRLYVGFRAGYSHFTYDVTDITIKSDYWQQTQNFSLRGLKCDAWYGEALAGLHVKIVKNFALGWSVRWRFPFHVSRDSGSKPWYIPGYGTSSFGFTASAIFTIPAKMRPDADANLKKP